MSRQWSVVLWTLILCLAFTAGAYAQRVAAPNPKVDAALVSAMALATQGDGTQSKAIVTSGDPANPVYTCLVRYRSPQALINSAATAQTGGPDSSIGVFRGTGDQVLRLAQDPSVVYIEPSYRLYLDNNAAVAEAEVDTVWAYTIPPDNTLNVDGDGVVAGLLDTGIDFEHSDFCTNPANTNTRVRWLWDHFDGTGTPPSGQGFSGSWNYGSLYSNTQMDGGSCPHQDTGGHGSHVAGTMAGDGSGTGNGQPADRFKGCAPKATIMCVSNSGDQFWDYTGYYAGSGTSVHGFDFIRTAAGNLGMPVVVNMSQGSNMGPHDGTTNFETGINGLVNNGDVVICVSAGNNARPGTVSGQKHDVQTVPSAGNATFLMGYRSSSGWPAAADLWYNANDRLQIEVMDSYGVWHGPYAPTGGPYTFTVDGRTNTLTSTLAASINGQNRWLVQFTDNTDSESTDYDWRIRVSPHAGNTLPDGGLVHCWLERNYRSYFYDSPEYTGTLGIPSCAEKAITVAAHTTKNSYVDVDGWAQNTSGTVGARAAFSSRGPTRTGTYRKPEISSGGDILASTLSQYYSTANSTIDQDGVHTYMSGTSMSTPMVSGVVALMLQKNAWTGTGTATPATIKANLLDTAISDANTGTVPNNDWGWGKMRADAAWNAVPTAAGVDDFTAVASEQGVQLNWRVTDDLDCVGFEVWRAATIFGGWTKVNEKLVTADGKAYRFMDATVPQRTGHFLYIVKSVDGRGGATPRASSMVDFGRQDRAALRQTQLQELVNE